MQQPVVVVDRVTLGEVIMADEKDQSTPVQRVINAPEGFDVETELQRIVQGGQVQEQQPGIFARIVQALVQGAGTALTPQDQQGAAILSQLAQQRQDQQNKQNQRQAIANALTQFRLQDLSNKIANKRQIEAEGRQEQRNISAEERAFGYDIKKLNAAFDIDTQKMKLQGQEARSLQDARNSFEEKMADKSQQFQKMMFELEKVDQNAARFITNVLSLTEATGDAGKAYDAVQAMRDGKKPNLKFLTGTQVAAMRAASSGGGGGGEGAGVFGAKGANKLIEKLAEETWVELNNGQVVMVKDLPREQIAGQGPSTKDIKRFLSTAESLEHVSGSIYGKAIRAAVGDSGAKTVDVSPMENLATQYSARLKTLKDKLSPEQIMTFVDDAKKQRPQDVEAIDRAVGMAGITIPNAAAAQPRAGQFTRQYPDNRTEDQKSADKERILVGQKRKASGIISGLEKKLANAKSSLASLEQRAKSGVKEAGLQDNIQRLKSTIADLESRLNYSREQDKKIP